MKIQINDLQPIVIPDHLLTDLHPKKFDASTSYLDRVCSKLKKKSYIEGALPLKLQCLLAYKDLDYSLPGGGCIMLENMAGIGLTGRIFEKEERQLRIFNETDPKCLSVLRANFRNLVSDTLLPSKDAFQSPYYAVGGYYGVGLIFLDFNNFTFKRYLKEPAYGAALHTAFQTSQKYVILNDCSIFYFRYGKKSYEVYSKLTGKIIKGPWDYFYALKDHFDDLKIGWTLARVEYFKETSFLLFEKTEEQRFLDIHENTIENLTTKVTVTP